MLTRFQLGLSRPLEQILSLLLGQCTCGQMGQMKGRALQLLAARFLAIRPTIVLFGDSFTQRAFMPGQWGARLATWYDRTADVILRGYSGYNSRWILEVAPQVFRSPLAPALVIVQAGTNDSVRNAPLRGRDPVMSRQHIAVEEYEENLTKIVQLVRSIGDGSACVLLMTPCPIDDAKRQTFEGSSSCMDQLWTNESVRQYVDACVRVGKQVSAPVVNLYDGFFEYSPAQWGRGTSWGTAGFVDGQGDNALLGTDGMHPSAVGGDAIFSLVTAAIKQHFPHLQPVNCHAYAEPAPPDRLPLDFPDHKTIDPNDAAGSMARYSATLKQRDHCGAIELVLDEAYATEGADAKERREPSPPPELNGDPALPTTDGARTRSARSTGGSPVCHPVREEGPLPPLEGGGLLEGGVLLEGGEREWAKLDH